MQTEYNLQAMDIRGISLQFDTFQTLNHDKEEREICHLGFIFLVVGGGELKNPTILPKCTLKPATITK